MGNQFLGFPVSKAKIATMITGTAAPSAHHTQHENGGSDEIDATGLTGAGGGGIGIADFITISLPFESVTGYTSTLVGSGSVTAEAEGLYLQSGATASSTAKAVKLANTFLKHLNYSKDIVLNFNVKFKSFTDAVSDFLIRVGGETFSKHIGILVVDGVLKGSVGDDNLETMITLETLGTTTYDKTRSFHIVYTAGVDCKFYVDGVLLGTITTNLPTSWDTFGASGFRAWSKNKTSAANKYIQITYFNTMVRI